MALGFPSLIVISDPSGPTVGVEITVRSMGI